MTQRTMLTFVLMDAPFESAKTTTAMRLLDITVKRGYDVNVFAYEGAVYLPFAGQTAHANAIHGNDVHEENHPLPKDWIAALLKAASNAGGCLDWANCGLCVDERGAGEAIDGVRRGTPADLVDFMKRSANTLVIPTH